MGIPLATARFKTLRGREVHVWPVIVRGADSVVTRFESLLPPSELKRAAAFRFEHLRRSFLLSHGALRTLIGSYLEISPEKAQFIQGSHGKPKLVGGGGTAVPLEFNMSHSGNVVLLAFSSTCELGVDVELIRPLEDMAGIADRFFSREESEELFSLAPEERERAFYLCWTRKEAYVKAVGEGLSIPLDSFRVTLRPGDPARFLHLNHDASLAQNWTLHNLELGDGELSTAYAAALAYCDAPRPVHVQPSLRNGRFVEFEMTPALRVAC